MKPSSYLLTPGTLNTSAATKEAMLHDWDSWDEDFHGMTLGICQRLTRMLGAEKDFVCVPMHGSGTFALEACLGTLLDEQSKVLVLSNGAYGKRIVTILSYLKKEMAVHDKGDFLPPLPQDIDKILERDPEITHVILVHCETSSGILNPVKEISEVVRKHKKVFILDAISSFGAIPLDQGQLAIDALVSSASYSFEGIPGLSFVLVRRDLLAKCAGVSHSYALDVYDQWQSFETNGRWRFTPPTHVVASFSAALQQHEESGGVRARWRRYNENKEILVSGMRILGFKTLLDDRWISPVIVTFLNPRDKNFHFITFYEMMKVKGFVIYPGKLTNVESFRIGCIGPIDGSVIRHFLVAVSETLHAMGVHDLFPGVEIDHNLLGAMVPHAGIVDVDLEGLTPPAAL